jgi:hypothetical protein
MDTEWRQYVGGEWITSPETFDDLDPYTGEVMAQVPRGTAADAARAVDAASAAFPAWSELPPAAKQDLFLKAAGIVRQRQPDLMGLATSETGTTFGFGMFQTEFVIGMLRQAAGIVYAPTGTIIPSDMPGAMAMGVRRPVGVVAGLAPWNAPLILSMRAVVGPAALGNTVVLKPSELSPLVGRTGAGRRVRRRRLPARRGQRRHPRARRGGTHRRGADDQPAGPPDQLHRVDRRAERATASTSCFRWAAPKRCRWGMARAASSGHEISSLPWAVSATMAAATVAVGVKRYAADHHTALAALGRYLQPLQPVADLEERVRPARRLG